MLFICPNCRFEIACDDEDSETHCPNCRHLVMTPNLENYTEFDDYFVECCQYRILYDAKGRDLKRVPFNPEAMKIPNLKITNKKTLDLLIDIALDVANIPKEALEMITSVRYMENKDESGMICFSLLVPTGVILAPRSVIAFFSKAETRAIKIRHHMEVDRIT